MDTLRKELTFEGGVNLGVDPHLLKSNEWLKLQNMWPYKQKLIGTRPSLLHEQDLLPVPEANWNGALFNNASGAYPTNVKHYAHWFRHLTPLKAVFMGSLDRVALICACNVSDKVTLRERFEGQEEVLVDLQASDVVLIVMPNDLTTVVGTKLPYPVLSGVRLGTTNNLTPSLIAFNGTIVASNKNCEYVVQVVPSSSLPLPSATVWPGIDYRFTKVNFGETNLNFRADGVIVYKNRFVYWRGNKLWFSDAFQPGEIYTNAVETAYLAVFFDTGITEDITALGNIYMSDVEEAGKSVLAVWSKSKMVFVTGEPATTIASTAEELFTPCVANTISVPSGCVSAASIVKTKHGMVWCGAESVWFMAKGNLPVEVGAKIAPRIREQSFQSAGRIFATFDDLCYRLVINAPGVGYNPYEALNEMWCLSFIGDEPSKESAAWFGPQVFTNADNAKINVDGSGINPPGPGGVSAAGLYCCAKLTEINDDKTWYIQPYSTSLGTVEPITGDIWGTRLGLASISTYLGVDITAPFRMVAAIQPGYTYQKGALYQASYGIEGVEIPYVIENVVTVDGMVGGSLQSEPVYVNSAGTALWAKRPLYAWMEASELLPAPYKISLQSANMTFDNPELLKMIDGYELTFKTLNPIALDSWWWPWEPLNDSPSPTVDSPNLAFLFSTVNVPLTNQNMLQNLWNEPVLTARRIPSPSDRRYNGLTAQLNVMYNRHKIITSNNGLLNPNWGKIRFSINNVTWIQFDLMDFDSDGIAKYVNVLDLATTLNAKVTALASALDINAFALSGYALKFANGNPLYIDLTAQGWEWFGFIPTGRSIGYGVNILGNNANTAQYINATGPVPCSTPNQIHFAKLAVRYRILEARPR